MTIVDEKELKKIRKKEMNLVELIVYCLEKNISFWIIHDDPEIIEKFSKSMKYTLKL